jgi:hypothetical protein
LVPPSIEDPEVFFDAYDQDAHGKFLRWRERNQRGYVISRRSASDAMLHRTYCGHFEHGDKSASLTRTMKVCSNNKGDLEGWARENLAARLYDWLRASLRSSTTEGSASVEVSPNLKAL